MKKSAFGCLAFFILCLYPIVSTATEVVVGKVKGTRGLVSILRDGKTKPAFPHGKIFLSDTIMTGSNGAIGILLEDNTLISMGPISRLEMKKFKFSPAKNEYEMSLKMGQGSFVYQSGLLGKLAPHAVTLDTPVGKISMLKGTDFKARFSE